MDNLNDQTATTAAPKPFSYEITPRAAHVGGGWRLQLFEGAFEVGGGIHPVTEEVTSDEAYQEALGDGEAWLISRGIPSSEVATIKTSALPDRALTRLADDDITTIWQTMPGGPAGWLKSFGFLQFARAIEEEVLDNNASVAAPASADNPSTAGVAKALADDDRYQHVRDLILDAMRSADSINKAGLNNALELLSELAAPVAQSTAGAANLDGAERDLCTALLACPHAMDEDRVVLYRNGAKDGGAYAQIAVRLREAFARLATPAAQAPAQVPTAAEARDQALEEAAKEADSVGHHWSGAPALAFFDLAASIRALRTASKDQQSALGEKGGE